jgi:predicted ATPase
MTFDEVLTHVLELLQRQGRVSYRALKRRFDLDDEYLEDLKAEIIQAQRLAVDEDGVVLVWSGEPPPQQQQQTQAALLAWLLEESERQPLLMVCEDLHWADASTLEWLGLLIDQAPTTRLLTLLTYRPEFRPPWASRSHLTQLTLSRFTRPQGEAMVTRVASGKTLPGEVLQQIVARTDGVPLFVEELTKMVLESGLLQERQGHYELTGPLPPLAIPTTLHDSLMARLDRLATVREVAQLGATLGREFAYELLQAVWPLDTAAG